jgi:hypothetical protein
LWINGDGNGGLRAIVARANCAKGRKRFRQTYVMPTSYVPDAILGYRVTNSTFSASPDQDAVEVTGHLDVHFWYAHSDNAETAVEKQTVGYSEVVPVVELDGERLRQDETVNAKAIREPQITEAYIRRNQIEFVVEMEFGCEVIGQTRLWVRVFEPPFMAEEGKKEEELLDDEFNEEEVQEADEFGP